MILGLHRGLNCRISICEETGTGSGQTAGNIESFKTRPVPVPISSPQRPGAQIRARPKKGVWNFQALELQHFIEAGAFQTPFFGLERTVTAMRVPPRWEVGSGASAAVADFLPGRHAAGHQGGTGPADYSG